MNLRLSLTCGQIHSPKILSFTQTTRFFTRQNTFAMPQGPRSQKDDFDLPAILQEYQNWPPSPGYIVWFEVEALNFKEHVLPPDELSALATLEALFLGQDGAIYRVSP